MLGAYSKWDADAFKEGLKRGLPIVLGYMPVGFAFGVLAIKNGLPPALAIAMGVLMFSGSGQFVFASMWGHGADILSTAAAVSIINLRYLLMSAAEAPWFIGIDKLKKFFLGWGVTDESFVVHAAAVQSGWRPNIAVCFVCNQTTQLGWVSGCAIGAFFGSYLDDIKPLGLDYAITAMFIALLVPQCTGKIHLLVAIFTMCLSISLKLAGFGQWNIAVATITGATIGLIMQKHMVGKK